MRTNACLVLLALSCALTVACGTSPNNNACVVNTAVTPTSGTADHIAAAPGDQVQFLLSSSVKGNCPLIADFGGVWSTSDSVNTTISNEAASPGLATCLHATTTPATIRNSSIVTGHPYPTATLTCR